MKKYCKQCNKRLEEGRHGNTQFCVPCGIERKRLQEKEYHSKPSVRSKNREYMKKKILKNPDMYADMIIDSLEFLKNCRKYSDHYEF